MVVHKGNDEPMEIPINKMSQRKRFVIVNNHVKELQGEQDHTNKANEKEIFKECSLQLDKMSKNSEQNYQVNRFQSKEEINQSSELSETDLNELKDVYKKCKTVLKKIERKYGHLLNTETRDRKRTLETDSEDECRCTKNKKIVFGDDGTQLPIDMPFEKHICPTKLIHYPHREQRNIQIEYQEEEIKLSDNLNELAHELKDPNLKITHRNKIIEKMKKVKQELSNDIKFNKRALVENLKSNPEEIFVFKGSNLFSLPGYKY